MKCIATCQHRLISDHSFQNVLREYSDTEAGAPSISRQLAKSGTISALPGLHLFPFWGKQTVVFKAGGSGDIKCLLGQSAVGIEMCRHAEKAQRARSNGSAMKCN